MSSVDEKKRALFAMIPTQESFTQFIKDMRAIKNDDDKSIANDVIDRLAEYACEAGIIKDLTLAALEQAFDSLPPRALSVNVPENVTFNDILEDIQAKSMNQLLEKLNLAAEEFGLPNISATMISRLRKEFLPDTPGKRCVLRVLAFWMAKYRPQLAWNYEQLFALPRSGEKTVNTEKPKEGVVIALNIQIKGDIVHDEMIDWVATELQQCLEDLRLFHLNKRMVETHGATVSLRIPKRPGLANEPRLYNQAIRDALALAHQMAVRWLLSDHSSPQKFLTIAIHAGAFAEANLHVQPILETRLPSESGIFLTEFAHLCARLAEVKITFEHISTNLLTGNGTILAVISFWSYTYCDFIPELLQDNFLPTTQVRYAQFQQELYDPERFPETSFKTLAKMNQFPNNALLFFEIAKVLFFRRMFYEADAILSKILLFYPQHKLTRVLRMMIYADTAFMQTDMAVYKCTFKRAEQEGEYLTSRHYDDEEVWCEVGLMFYGNALQSLAYLRTGRPEYLEHFSRDSIFEYLRRAEHCFAQGSVVSSTGKDNRSLFWQLYALSLIELLESDPDLFNKQDREMFEDRHNVLRKAGMKFFQSIGWISIGSPTADIMLNRVLGGAINVYATSVLSRGYTPNILYSFCCLIWDFVPLLTPKWCHTILAWLEQARILSEELIRQNIGIYSIASSFASLQAPQKFLQGIEMTRKKIQQLLTEEELRENDDTPISPEKMAEISKVKLMYLHIDLKVEPGALVREEG